MFPDLMLPVGLVRQTLYQARAARSWYYIPTAQKTSQKKNQISDTTLRNIAAYKGNLMAGMKFSSGTLTSFPFLVIPILVDSKPSNLCRNEPCFMQQHTTFYSSPLGEISICSCVARRVPDMHQLINPGPSRPLNS